MSISRTPPAGPAETIALKPKPWGAYRRAVTIAADGDVVRAAMEDDVHHFTLTLRHSDGYVAGVEGETIRAPWSICPGALPVLQTLVGKSIESVVNLPAPMRAQHCMHLYDLAILAARHAGKTAFTRRYHISGDYDQSPPVMRLWRDGIEQLAWSIDSRRISGSRYDGIALNRLGDALKGAASEDAEAALILRRASLVAAVRMIDLDQYRNAGKANPVEAAVCYALQPDRIALAERTVGNGRDFHGSGHWPLS